MAKYELRGRGENDGDIELFCDGDFLASWGLTVEEIPASLRGFINAMCEEAHDNGERIGKLNAQKHYREVFGVPDGDTDNA